MRHHIWRASEGKEMSNVPMTAERYRELNMQPQQSPLTQDEFAQGWHYCWDWDGLFVNAYDDEGEGASCTCYPRAEL